MNERREPHHFEAPSASIVLACRYSSSVSLICLSFGTIIGVIT